MTMPLSEGNPGSYNDFASHYPDNTPEQNDANYSNALAEYRESLITRSGLDPQTFHELGGLSIGDTLAET
jgi:hypothetical protein